MPIKIPVALFFFFFSEIKKPVLTHTQFRETLNYPNSLEKDTVGELTLSALNIYIIPSKALLKAPLITILEMISPSMSSCILDLSLTLVVFYLFVWSLMDMILFFVFVLFHFYQAMA